jgi:isoleucyl-tRNA synthetase
MRKEADFEVTQRIRVTVAADDEMKAAIEAHREYVMGEILATELGFGDCAGAAEAVLNGHSMVIKVEKA